ncbi:MAG: hypothetical protein QXN16_00625 [Candidatus Micrarchaeaceae archaeon]
MADKPLWIGKGQTMYEVIIDKTAATPKKPKSIEDAFKYYLIINGAGDYANAYLGDSSEELFFLADTKEGIAYALGLYVLNQLTNAKERQSVGLPPEPLNPNNTVVYDYAGLFSPKEIFNILKPKSYDDITAPVGERPFLATIENEDGEVGKYRVFVGNAPVYIYNYSWDWEDGGTYFDDLDAKDVNRVIRNELSDMKIEGKAGHEITPNIENTKIVNVTDNPEFTPSRIFATTKPLKVMNAKPSLQLMTKAPVQNINIVEKAPPEPIIMPDLEKDLQIKKKDNVKNYEQRLRA